MKLDFIRIERDNCPDHIIEEVRAASLKLGESFEKVIDDIPPPILLAAFSYVFVSMMSALAEPNTENLRKVAKLSAQILIDDMERIIRIKELENEGK